MRPKAQFRGASPLAAFLIALIVALLAFPTAAAETVRDLYVRGDYAGAMREGEAQNTSTVLAEAARAAIADAQLRDMPCLECLRRAENFARRAVTLDARNADALVLLAVSLGLEARIVGIVRAKLNRYPEQAKEALENAVRLAPTDGAALAAMGAWHIEVVRNGGILGSMMYGAEIETGKKFFRQGIAADAGNLVLPYQYALSLAGYDAARNRGEIVPLFEAAASGSPRTAYEAALKARAGELAQVLKDGPSHTFTDLVKKYQGYP